MLNGRKLRVAIDCRIQDHRQGIGTAVLSLAHALSESSTANQEYSFIVREEVRDWLEPHIFGPCRLVGIPEPGKKLGAIRRVLRSIPAWRAIRTRMLGKKAPEVPLSDGYVESEKFDLVHFPTQVGYLTRLPSIYQPWDLQHLHYPEFFSAEERARRELVYRALCGQARCVCVQTQWSKTDVAEKYKIDQRKIAVIPWGSVLDSHKPPSGSAINAAIDKFKLPGQFFFYPAVTWPHKNHAVILRALQVMKSRHGQIVHACFTGKSTDHRRNLDALANQLGIADQLHYLGFVIPEELQAIFATATAMIFASKFEGFGLPLLEAFHAHLPVICANSTMLPEVAGDAALYFEPDSPEELAAHVQLLLEHPQKRQELISRGNERLAQYSMKDTAAKFQKLYEEVCDEAERRGPSHEQQRPLS